MCLVRFSPDFQESLAVDVFFFFPLPGPIVNSSKFPSMFAQNRQAFIVRKQTTKKRQEKPTTTSEMYLGLIRSAVNNDGWVRTSIEHLSL